MVKKLLLSSAVFLSVTGAWATEPVVTTGSTVKHNGVNYKITSSTPNIGDVINGSATTEVTYANGVVTYTTGRTDTQTKEYTMNVEATNADTSATTVNIENFDNNMIITEEDRDNAENTYTASENNDSYMSNMATAASSTSEYKFQTYASIYAEDNNAYFVKGTRALTKNLDKYYYYKHEYIDDEGENVTDYVAITSIIVKVNKSKKTTWQCSYKNTSIASGFLNSSVVTTVTFNAEVENIKAGAFQYATALKEIIPASSTYFEWNDQIKYLFAKNIEANTDTAIVAAGIYASGATLPDNIVRIYNYAFYNVQKDYNNNNIVVKSNNSSLTVNTSLQGSNVTFSYPTGMAYESDGKGYVITGTVQNSDLSTLPSDGLYLDFTGATIWDALTINNAMEGNVESINRLYYFPSGTTVNGTNKNIVINKECANLDLIDETPFYNKYEFTASQSILNRTVAQNDTKWGTVVLPFDVELDLTNYWVGSLSEYNSETNTLKFSKVMSLKANTPYVIKNISGSTTPFSNSSSSVVPVTSAFTNVFRGTYETITLGKDGCDYGYTTSGKFIKCNGTNIMKPFHGYFHIGSSTHQAPNARYFNEYEEEEFFEDDETGISEISENENAKVIFNTNGERVSNMNTPGVYVVNGKKIIKK